jgi:hypothetical protein
LARFEIGSFDTLGHFDQFSPDELRVDLRFAIFEKHRDHLAEVGPQFIGSGRLCVRSRKAGDEPYQQAVSVERSTTAV